MYSPDFTHRQAELSRKMETFLKAFQTRYLMKVIDDNIESDFLKELAAFYNSSEEGKSLQAAEKEFDLFKGKMFG